MVDERLRFWLVASGVLALAGLIAFGTWYSLRKADSLGAPALLPKAKVFARTLAEDLRVTRHGVHGVDLVRCRVCRLEKRKKGVLTFGGMNVLVLEGLDVVLPPDAPAPNGNGAQGKLSGREGGNDGGAQAVLRELGISDGFLAKRGIPFRFSGVRISGLALGRLDATNGVERVLSARTGEAGRGGLELSGCRIAENGSERDVGKARLALAGGVLRLSWQGGDMEIIGRHGRSSSP